MLFFTFVYYYFLAVALSVFPPTASNLPLCIFKMLWYISNISKLYDFYVNNEKSTFSLGTWLQTLHNNNIRKYCCNIWPQTWHNVNIRKSCRNILPQTLHYINIKKSCCNIWPQIWHNINMRKFCCWRQKQTLNQSTKNSHLT